MVNDTVRLSTINHKPSTMSNALFILGMHRSGTSALSRVINLLGAELGGRLMAAASDNERGFWEHESAVQIHEDLLRQLGHGWQDGTPLPEGWQEMEAAQDASKQLAALIDLDFLTAPLWAIKDPRLSLLFPLWLPLLKERGMQPHCIIAWRNPMEVAASLQKRDAMDENAALLCWLAYTLESMRHALPHPHAIIAYDDLLKDWRISMAKLGKDLGLNWPKTPSEVGAEIDAFLAPELRHHQKKLALPESMIGSVVQDTLTLLHSGRLEETAVNALHQQWYQLAAPFAPLLREARAESFQWRNDALNARHQAQDIATQMESLRSQYHMDLQEYQQREQQFQEILSQMEQQLHQLYDSTSWKLTEPLRRARKLFGNT
jgi:hypothetical protein